MGKSHIFFSFLFIFGFISAENVVINVTNVAATVDRRFVSFGLDQSQLSQYGWTLTLRQAKFAKLASHLAPSYLRCGGSAGDMVYYDMQNTEKSESSSDLPPGYHFALNATRLDELVNFVDNIGFDLALQVNAGPGPRGNKWEGAWTTNNAHTLLEHIKSRNLSVSVLEFGNEPNYFFTAVSVSAYIPGKEYGKDAITFRKLVDSVFGSNSTSRPRIAAPDMGVQNPLLHWMEKGWLTGFLEGSQPETGTFDIMTYHDYPLVSQRALPPALDPWGATVEHAMDPNYFTQLNRRAEVVTSLKEQYAPSQELWLGESAQAAIGGQEGVSSGFVDSFYYADTLGRCALAGYKIVVRQALAWSDYGIMLAPGNWTGKIGDPVIPVADFPVEPRPDYWLALIWKKTMGERVLAVSATSDDKVITYAHCGRGINSISTVVINLNIEKSAGFKFSLDDSQTPLSRKEWHLTLPEGASLTDPRVALNGVELIATDSGEIPSLDGIAGDVTTEFLVQAQSVAFTTILYNSTIPACA